LRCTDNGQKSRTFFNPRSGGSRGARTACRVTESARSKNDLGRLWRRTLRCARRLRLRDCSNAARASGERSLARKISASSIVRFMISAGEPWISRRDAATTSTGGAAICCAAFRTSSSTFSGGTTVLTRPTDFASAFRCFLEYAGRSIRHDEEVYEGRRAPSPGITINSLETVFTSSLSISLLTASRLVRTPECPAQWCPQWAHPSRRTSLFNPRSSSID
jgi:hypothetical protein